MLSIRYLIFVNGYNEKNITFEISIFDLYRVENYISRLCPGPLGTPPPKNTQKG